MEEYILKLLKELKEEIRLADQRIKQLELKSNKGTANGYAELDVNAKVPIARIPEIPLSNINIDVDKDWNAKNIVNVNQLGIGTTTPSAGLEINSNLLGPGGWIKGIHFTSYLHSAITIKNPNANKGGLVFGLHALYQAFYFGHYNPNDSWDEYIMIIDAAYNRVGIGTITPSYQLQLSQDSAAKPSTNTWTVASDKRIKKNIVPADLKRCYEIVKNLPLVYFSWDDGLYTNNQIQDKSQLGWLSQDVEQFFPKSITTANLDYAQEIQIDEEEYEEQAYEIKISKEKQIEIRNGKPVLVEKIIERKELLFDEIEVVDEQGNVVKDEEGNILKHKVPRMIKKKRPVMKPVKSIPDCKGMNADQIIKALYGAVQYLIQKIESLEKKEI